MIDLLPFHSFSFVLSTLILRTLRKICFYWLKVLLCMMCMWLERDALIQSCFRGFLSIAAFFCLNVILNGVCTRKRTVQAFILLCSSSPTRCDLKVRKLYVNGEKQNKNVFNAVKIDDVSILAWSRTSLLTSIKQLQPSYMPCKIFRSWMLVFFFFVEHVAVLMHDSNLAEEAIDTSPISVSKQFVPVVVKAEKLQCHLFQTFRRTNWPYAGFNVCWHLYFVLDIELRFSNQFGNPNHQ